MTGEAVCAAAPSPTDSEWAPQPWSAETTRPSSGANALPQAPNSRPRPPLSGTKNPQLTHFAGAACDSGVRGPWSVSYHRSAVSSRPYADSTRARPGAGSSDGSPGPASASSASVRGANQSLTASSPSRTTRGTRRSSSALAGSRSPMPTSPGRNRSCHGTQAGASRASGPGSSTVSSTVTSLDLGALVTVTAHRHPAEAGEVHLAVDAAG